MARTSLWWLLPALFLAAVHAHPNLSAPSSRHSIRQGRRAVDGSRAAELAGDCLQEQWHEQRLDHFSRAPEVGPHATAPVTWQQRVVVCGRYWSTNPDTGERGPIFFYAGNEGDVYLYVNNTGLMWENAEEHGALLVFAEHRYYGKSEPYGPDSWRTNPTHLTTGQALADYAALIYKFKHSTAGAQDSAVVVFGGSYGGELAVWMRVRYSHLVTGSIAASAPILGFPGFPGFNPTDFWQVVTYDASPAAGAPAACVNNTRLAFRVLLSLAGSEEGRISASRLLRLCQPLKSSEDVMATAYWLQIMETEDGFSFERKGQMEASNPKVQEWEQLMWRFQQRIPSKTAPEDAKWLLMDKVFAFP